MSRSRAERRAIFEARSQRGLARFAIHNAAAFPGSAEVPVWKKARQFRKAWCSCEMCSPSAFGARREPTLAERRFLAVAIEAEA